MKIENESLQKYLDFVCFMKEIRRCFIDNLKEALSKKSDFFDVKWCDKNKEVTIQFIDLVVPIAISSTESENEATVHWTKDYFTTIFFDDENNIGTRHGKMDSGKLLDFEVVVNNIIIPSLEAQYKKNKTELLKNI